MSALYDISLRPEMDEPVMVVVLDGFVDAGLASSTALSRITDQLDVETVATFDTNRLLDFRSRRPVMQLREGVNTGLTWPTIELQAGSDVNGQDVLFLVGHEPDHEWMTFCDAVYELALTFDTKMIVGLGAYPAPVPHTRATRLATTAPTEELATQLAQVRGNLDVPAGVQAAIEYHCTTKGLPGVGLWAQVPHYAAAMPYPAAAATLIRALSKLTGLSLETEPLDDTARIANERIDTLISGNTEHELLVRQLEEQYDQEESESATLVAELGDIPSGDELAADFQRFLRENED